MLRYVLHNQPPEEGWTKTDIATACGLSRHGGATEHIRGLLALELLEEQDGRYRPGRLDSTLAMRVVAFVDELEQVPDRRIDELLSERPG